MSDSSLDESEIIYELVASCPLPLPFRSDSLFVLESVEWELVLRRVYCSLL